MHIHQRRCAVVRGCLWPETCTVVSCMRESCHRNYACVLYELSDIFSFWLKEDICGYRYTAQGIHVIKIVSGDILTMLSWGWPMWGAAVILHWSISCEIAHRWMPQDLTDGQWTLFHVIAWCLQATIHYMSQYLSTYGVTMPRWVNGIAIKGMAHTVITPQVNPNIKEYTIKWIFHICGVGILLLSNMQLLNKTKETAFVDCFTTIHPTETGIRHWYHANV